MSAVPEATCDYCGARMPTEDLEPRPRGGLRCRDGEACDERDAQRHRQRVAELRRQQRAGEELTEAERQELAE